MVDLLVSEDAVALTDGVDTWGGLSGSIEQPATITSNIKPHNSKDVNATKVSRIIGTRHMALPEAR
jgi:hypothetical protein